MLGGEDGEYPGRCGLAPRRGFLARPLRTKPKLEQQRRHRRIEVLGVHPYSSCLPVAEAPTKDRLDRRTPHNLARVPRQYAAQADAAAGVRDVCEHRVADVQDAAMQD